MKVITFEQLFHYPNSDQWLYEEVIIVDHYYFQVKNWKIHQS